MKETPQENLIQNTQNLETLTDEASLTKQELEEFKKLPKEEQEKQKQEKLAKLLELNNKLDQEIQKAIQTGELDQAKKIKEQLEKEIKDLQEQIEMTERQEVLEKAVKMEVTVGGKTKEELIKEMKENKVWISDWAKDILSNPDFTISKRPQHLSLIIISLKDLGFPVGASTDEIYEKVKKLGLELCPAEVGPNVSLKFNDLPTAAGIFIGMKQISDPKGAPLIFDVGTRNGLNPRRHESHLAATDFVSSSRWSSEVMFVLCLPHK